MTEQGRTNSAVESRKAPAADAIFQEALCGAYFDSLVASEAREIMNTDARSVCSSGGSGAPRDSDVHSFIGLTTSCCVERESVRQCGYSTDRPFTFQEKQ